MLEKNLDIWLTTSKKHDDIKFTLKYPEIPRSKKYDTRSYISTLLPVPNLTRPNIEKPLPLGTDHHYHHHKWISAHPAIIPTTNINSRYHWSVKHLLKSAIKLIKDSSTGYVSFFLDTVLRDIKRNVSVIFWNWNISPHKPEPPPGSEFLSLLRTSEFFQFILQTFGRLSESFGKTDQIDHIEAEHLHFYTWKVEKPQNTTSSSSFRNVHVIF